MRLVYTEEDVAPSAKGWPEPDIWPRLTRLHPASRTTAHNAHLLRYDYYVTYLFETKFAIILLVISNLVAPGWLYYGFVTAAIVLSIFDPGFRHIFPALQDLTRQRLREASLHAIGWTGSFIRAVANPVTIWRGTDVITMVTRFMVASRIVLIGGNPHFLFDWLR